jgi:hypothetical protein
MADAPFAAAGVVEQAKGSEEEPAPASHPYASVGAAEVTKDRFDLVAVREPIIPDTTLM